MPVLLRPVERLFGAHRLCECRAMPRAPRCVVVTLVVGLTLSANACDLSTPAVELESVADAPAHFEASRLSFTGTLRGDLLGEHSWRNSSSVSRGSVARGPELFMIVVPVVPQGWDETQPVPLWLTTSNKRSKPGQRDDWLVEAKQVESGRQLAKVMDYADREPGFRKTSGWQKAIDAAEAAHGITSDPHAPVVMWPAPG